MMVLSSFYRPLTRVAPRSVICRHPVIPAEKRKPYEVVQTTYPCTRGRPWRAPVKHLSYWPPLVQSLDQQGRPQSPSSFYQAFMHSTLGPQISDLPRCLLIPFVGYHDLRPPPASLRRDKDLIPASAPSPLFCGCRHFQTALRQPTK